MNFDIKATTDKLIAMRVKFGADTPDGHTCSNLVEQLNNYATAAIPAREAAKVDRRAVGANV